jgi:hypothetical protein
MIEWVTMVAAQLGRSHARQSVGNQRKPFDSQRLATVAAVRPQFQILFRLGD